MKANIKILTLSLLATTLTVSATPPKVESVKPKDGIYVTYGMHSIVLELKNDQFRYWFSSDRLPAKGEEIDYPLEGSFTAEGDKIVLQHKKFIPLESNWTFKTLDGVVTMWRSDAIKHLAEKDGKFDPYYSGKENFFRTGGGSILVPTDKTAEEAWKSPQYAVLTEEEHKALIEKNAEQDGAEQPATAPESKADGEKKKPKPESEGRSQ